VSDVAVPDAPRVRNGNATAKPAATKARHRSQPHLVTATPPAGNGFRAARKPFRSSPLTRLVSTSSAVR